MTDKDKLSKIIEIIATKNGVADSQEFGLSYSQAINYLEEIEDVVKTENDLVDKIASFFEEEENWMALKNCWLEDGRSNDLRKLLKRALKM